MCGGGGPNPCPNTANVKVWVSLFTCLHSRAIHCEIVRDCSAPAFLLAFRRFVAFFCKGALFRGKGGPLVFEKPARHLPRQGRGFVRPPVKFVALKNKPNCFYSDKFGSRSLLVFILERSIAKSCAIAPVQLSSLLSDDLSP